MEDLSSLQAGAVAAAVSATALASVPMLQRAGNYASVYIAKNYLDQDSSGKQDALQLVNELEPTEGGLWDIVDALEDYHSTDCAAHGLSDQWYCTEFLEGLIEYARNEEHLDSDWKETRTALESKMEDEPLYSF